MKDIIWKEFCEFQLSSAVRCKPHSSFSGCLKFKQCRKRKSGRYQIFEIWYINRGVLVRTWFFLCQNSSKATTKILQLNIPAFCNNLGEKFGIPCRILMSYFCEWFLTLYLHISGKKCSEETTKYKDESKNLDCLQTSLSLQKLTFKENVLLSTMLMKVIMGSRGVVWTKIWELSRKNTYL